MESSFVQNEKSVNSAKGKLKDEVKDSSSVGSPDVENKNLGEMTEEETKEPFSFQFSPVQGKGSGAAWTKEEMKDSSNVESSKVKKEDSDVEMVDIETNEPPDASPSNAGSNAGSPNVDDKHTGDTTESDTDSTIILSENKHTGDTTDEASTGSQEAVPGNWAFGGAGDMPASDVCPIWAFQGFYDVQYVLPS
jgi:hypothetical protein